MKNSLYISLLKALKKAKIDTGFPCWESTHTTLDDHLITIQLTQHELDIHIDADVTIEEGYSTPGSYFEAPYSESPKVTIHFHEIRLALWDQYQENVKIKPFQREGLIEIIKPKIKEELC